MPPKPLSPDLTGGIQVTPSPLFPSQPLTPPGPLGFLAPGTPPPQLPLAREMPPGLSLAQRLRAYGPGLIGSLVALGGRGPLSRTFGGALAAGGTEKALGGEFTPEALRFGATQGIAETGFGLGRFGKSQVRAKKVFEGAEQKFQAATQAHAKAVEQAQTDHQTALIQHQTDVKQLQTQYRALETQRAETLAKNQATHTQAQREFAEQGATSIAEVYKTTVPSWKEFPSNERGIAEMVYGKGPERLSQTYDRALKEVVESGRGIQVPMRVEDVEALKLTPSGFIDIEKGPPTHAYVDAGDLAKALPGTWKTNRGMYRRGFNVLDQQGLGNEEARSEYRSGQSLIEFTDKSKMLAGGQFNPEAARKALYELKNVDTIRKRGEGDVFRGAIAEAAQAQPPKAPLDPPLTPKPLLPQKPLKPSPLTPPKKQETGVTKQEIPLGHALGGVGGLLAGHTVGHPYLGFGLGAGIGGAIGPKAPFYRGGPPSPPTSPMLPTTLAEMLRLFLTKPKGTSSQ